MIGIASNVIEEYEDLDIEIFDNLSGSLFPTYVTEVGLYDDGENLIGIARLSKPIPNHERFL